MRILTLGWVCCVLGCASPLLHQSLSTADSTALRAAFDSMYAATARLDIGATLSAYDTAPAFAHVFDGQLLRGRLALDRFVRAGMASLRPFEETHVDSTHLIALSNDVALLVVAYREVIVDTAGHRTPGHGMWTNLFVRRADGWKILFGQSSFLAEARQ